MSETIWRATDNDGRCWYYGEKPDWSEHQFYSQDGRVLEYYGTEKPPPGECWEMTVTRKGDIDTDGEPIGWKIVGIGKDGSVLCEKGNGQRRRYSFGDWAKEQPSGEAWERLVEACRAYCAARILSSISPLGAEIQKAYAAYEADKPSEPTAQQATIERLTKERDEAKAEAVRLRRELDAVVEHHSRWTGAIIKALPEYARFSGDLLHGVLCAIEAIKTELANEQASSNQVIAERDRTIAELQAKLERPEMQEVVRVDRASKTGWSVGDIVRCRHHSGAWRVWRVYGVFLGAVNQESVIEMECLDKDANLQGWACVPEDLLDLLTAFLRPLGE